MSKYMIGILIILFGIYNLLKNFGIDLGLESIVGTYWPVIIIVIGIKFFLEGLIRFISGLKKDYWRTRKLIHGTIIIVLGVFLLGNNLGWFEMTFSDFWSLLWPLLLIYIGINILFKPKWYEVDIDREDDKHLVRRKSWVGEVVLGGGNTWNLDDVKIWHGIGSTYVDLTSAIIPEREVMIDIVAMVGEITLLLPEDIPIKVNAGVKVGELNMMHQKYSGKGRFVTYESEDYKEKQKKLNIMISLSVGEVTIKRVD
ncbi:hypothetical protein BHF71_06620 [Vulcanibacillus modesticaldus]|uniref:Cell wall-active antibiotics response LiaF-like C-terminal domain-containing protein n=1 Tax=Vulcanibacillus modesticaldus TaxID=337097 RepID=A0A1D2YWF1_9BACI|nr:cell wall-active antibiotics response protein LiaF [Vulcanibacillus modesticaldus]OEG00030.1 hypothetical protein BHF71_06620 [Vulcanibacillus modesticaldus]